MSFHTASVESSHQHWLRIKYLEQAPSRPCLRYCFQSATQRELETLKGRLYSAFCQLRWPTGAEIKALGRLYKGAELLFNACGGEFLWIVKTFHRTPLLRTSLRPPHPAELQFAELERALDQQGERCRGYGSREQRDVVV